MSDGGYVRCLAVAIAGLVLALPCAGTGPDIADRCDLTSAASRSAHGVTMPEASALSVAVRVGARVLSVGGVRLRAGQSLTARMAPLSGSGTLVVRLATPPDDYGKRQCLRVDVDGRAVCFSRDVDPGGGSWRSLFAPVAESAGAHLVRVTADKGAGAPTIVSCLSLLPSNPRTPDSVRARMAVALLSSQQIGYGMDDAEITRLNALIPHAPLLDPQVAVLYNFSSRKPKENATEIRRLADLARRTGIPLRIAFQFHWAGIPSGVPDGAGGTYTDLPYQMITFSPDQNVDDADLASLLGGRYDPRFGRTIPNVWGNTPWLTFNHPRLNEFRRRRLRSALAAWWSERERLDAEGKAALLPGELSTGDETIYWAGNVDDSGFAKSHGGKARTDLSADFNPFTVRDAARDGVDLDPRDGLSLTERFWLHSNLASWQQKIVRWMSDAIPGEAIRVSPSGARYHDDLTRRNVYTEPYAMPCFPMQKISQWHPGLEVGYVLDGRSGGEYWSGATMLPWLLKEREMGRIALPNLECTGCDDGQLLACLRAAYACGARYATLYNWSYRSNITELLSAFARTLVAPALVLDAPASGGTATRRVWIGPADAFGTNRVTVTVARGSGRFRVRVHEVDAPLGRDVGVWVSVPSGPPRELSVDLPSLFSVVPGGRYEVVVEIAPDSDLAFAASADGQLAVRIEADVAQERARSLAIADPVDAMDLLDSVAWAHSHGARTDAAAEALAEARRLLDEGHSRDAYRAGIRAEQLSLPATFDVLAPGAQLGPLPVRVRFRSGTVRVRVLKLFRRGVDLAVTSPVAQVVTASWGGERVSTSVRPGAPMQIGLVARHAAPPRSGVTSPRKASAAGLRPRPPASSTPVRRLKAHRG